MRLGSFLGAVLLATAWLHGAGCGAGQDMDPAQEPAPAGCAIERTAHCVATPLNRDPCKGEPIQVGTHCDDIFICVADERAARAIMDAASGFTCAPGPGEPAMCAGSPWTCQWNPGTIDDAELGAICAVTVLPAPPTIACMVYV
jgi:hypothetical protein